MSHEKLVYFGILWYTLVYVGIRWYTLVYVGIRMVDYWYACGIRFHVGIQVVYVWYMFGIRMGIPLVHYWYTVVYFGILWYTLHTKYQYIPTFTNISIPK